MSKGKTGENVCTVNWPLSPWSVCVLCVFISKRRLAESPSLLDSKQHLQTEAIIILVNCHVFLNSSLKMQRLHISSLGQRGSESCFVPMGLLCGSLSDLETTLCSPLTGEWLGQLPGPPGLGFRNGSEYNNPVLRSPVDTKRQPLLGSLFYKVFENET